MRNHKGNCTKFADELQKYYPDHIIGVESFGMSHRLEEDSLEGNEFEGKDIDENPINTERSKHFIITLCEYFNTNKLSGNLILNCGSNHNAHIEAWIANGEIDLITGMKANYIRINTID